MNILLLYYPHIIERILDRVNTCQVFHFQHFDKEIQEGKVIHYQTLLNFVTINRFTSRHYS
jgi:flavin-binding protein dodecin